MNLYTTSCHSQATERQSASKRFAGLERNNVLKSIDVADVHRHAVLSADKSRDFESIRNSQDKDELEQHGDLLP